MFVCVCVFKEQGEGHNGADRGGVKRAQNQMPYFLSRGAQDQAIIKAGYCVKQGAVVRHTHTLRVIQCRHNEPSRLVG